jgi:group I intron endonuclease
MIEKICGVYMIQSKIKPERVYIGSSMNIHNRFNLHRNKLRKNLHHTPKLQHHYNKYGLDDLIFLTLESFKFISKEHLREREQFYIDTIKPWFNALKIACINGEFKLSRNSCQRISDASKNKPKSEEHKKALSKAWENRRLTPDSEETRELKRLANIGRKPWNTGLTSETDSRLLSASEKKRGQKRPQEEKDRISNTLKGRKHTEEHNRKVREANKGKILSSETKEKLRKISLEWWAKKREAEEKEKDNQLPIN